MGRRADLRPKFGRLTYEAKLRRPGDRIDGNGHKKEGGQIFSRHFEANNPDHAQRIANRLAKKNNARVVSIAKVSPEKLIGNFNTWGLRDIIGMPVFEKGGIKETTTLDEIVFGYRKGR